VKGTEEGRERGGGGRKGKGKGKFKGERKERARRLRRGGKTAKGCRGKSIQRSSRFHPLSPRSRVSTLPHLPLRLSRSVFLPCSRAVSTGTEKSFRAGA